jgi:hypothetical protein
MDDEARRAEIEAEFPGWHVWKSDTGPWWAARKVTLTAEQSGVGCAQYLRANSATELHGDITADEARLSRSGIAGLDAGGGRADPSDNSQ